MAVRLLSEPLSHFLLAGAVLFALIQYHARESAPERIVIAPQHIAGLKAAYKADYGGDPDAKTIGALLRRQVEGEILYREARARGLDRDDQIVRRRLIQKMQFLLQDADASPTPTDDELRGYYRAHLSRYREPPRFSLSHVYFADGTGGRSASRARAEQVLARLPDNLTRAPERGDVFAGPYDLTGLDTEQVERLFGAGELSARLARAPPHRWAGPWRSAYGWHLVRVQAVQPGGLLPFDRARGRIIEDWAAQRQRDAAERSFAAIKARYEVILPGGSAR